MGFSARGKCGKIGAQRRGQVDNNSKEKLTGLIAWVVMFGFVALLVILSRRESGREAERRAKEREIAMHPPAEFVELTNRIDRLCCDFERDKARFKTVLDVNSITNSSWFQEIDPLILEAIAKIEKTSEAIDILCTDAKIALATNRYFRLEIEFKYDEAMERIGARDADGAYSAENLSNLRRLYSLLDRHRALWRRENGEFVFSNEELDLECNTLLALIEKGKGQ